MVSERPRPGTRRSGRLHASCCDARRWPGPCGPGSAADVLRSVVAPERVTRGPDGLVRLTLKKPILGRHGGGGDRSALAPQSPPSRRARGGHGVRPSRPQPKSDRRPGPSRRSATSRARRLARLEFVPTRNGEKCQPSGPHNAIRGVLRQKRTPSLARFQAEGRARLGCRSRG